MANSVECLEKFPANFLFGAASSAYQIEGGYKDGGKGEHVYDYCSHKNHEKFHNSSNADIACDSYNKWREDIGLLKELGVDFYRFSISWSRILPNGYSNKINPAGVKFYQDFIDELLKNGIQPMVTMYHWDLPMSLQELGGWTNTDITDYFVDYAKVLFEHFGNKVKYWITINSAPVGYGDSVFPPFIDQPGRANYLCTYNMILAHAKTYRLYEKEYKNQQKGKVSIVVDGRWCQSGSNLSEDKEAAERVLQFEVGIWLNPIFEGDFPQIVKDRIDRISKMEGYSRSRLPKFSSEESSIIKGSCDFIGLNLYTTYLVKNIDIEHLEETSVEKDSGAKQYQDDAWKKSKSSWLKVYPEGAQNILRWIKEKYQNPEIFITENGFSDGGELEDTDRIDYLKSYLKYILKAIYEDKVNIKGYAVWSLLDNFEWMSGYSEKFGLYQVNFDDPGRTRTPKKSALWYKNVIQRKALS